MQKAKLPLSLYKVATTIQDTSLFSAKSLAPAQPLHVFPGAEAALAASREAAHLAPLSNPLRLGDPRALRVPRITRVTEPWIRLGTRDGVNGGARSSHGR